MKNKKLDGGNKVDALVFRRHILTPEIKKYLTPCLKMISPQQRLISSKFRFNGMSGNNPNCAALSLELFSSEIKQKLKKI